MDRDVVDPGLAEVSSFTPYNKDRKPSNRRSPFDIKLEQISSDPDKHNKTYAIQSYANEDSARQTLGNLRRKFGTDTTSYGWDIQMGDVGDGRHSIVVRYAPQDVTQGAAEAHEAKVEARRRARVTAVPDGSNSPLSEEAAAEHPEANPGGAADDSEVAEVGKRKGKHSA